MLEQCFVVIVHTDSNNLLLIIVLLIDIGILFQYYIFPNAFSALHIQTSITRQETVG